MEKEKAEEELREIMRGISLADLFNLKVLIAGKKEEKVREIPASVSVITRFRQ